MEIIPSLACARPLFLGEDIREMARSGITSLHLDLMDDRYVPNLALSFDAVESVREQFPSMLLDVHLMVQNPGSAVERLGTSGADRIAIHRDRVSFRLLERIRSLGAMAGVAVLPGEPLGEVIPFLGHCDFVLLMGVAPGFSGHPFQPAALERLRELAVYRAAHPGCRFTVTVDGGIDEGRAADCMALGADAVVAGALAVFGQPQPLGLCCKRFLALFGAHKEVGV